MTDHEAWRLKQLEDSIYLLEGHLRRNSGDFSVDIALRSTRHLYNREMDLINGTTTIACQDCGIADGSVSRRNCPYDQDVNDKITEVVLCDNCADERARDI